jgi:protein ImuA
MSLSRAALLQDLAQRIQEIESRAHPRRSPIPLGIPGLDDCLPADGLPAGSLVEVLSTAAGAGAWTLALLLAERARGQHKALVVADDRGWFYPPAASKLGVDLERCLVVRPASLRDGAAAFRQALRCTAVGAALGWFDQLRPSESRHLQLAAETGGGVGFLLRPATAVRTPSFAVLRLLIHPLPARDFPRRVGVEVVRCRGWATTTSGATPSLILEIDDETGHVRVPPRVASPATGTPRRRASG